MSILAYNNCPRGPTITFPKWDGQPGTVPIFLAQIESYKADPWFARVTNWIITLPTEAASQRVYADLMKDRIPAAQLN